MALISVIVPVYKVEPYLHRCVDSILTQSFTDFELILVDDGSPDNCPAICDEYAQKDSRVVVIHQQNGGLSAARNAGIDWACANSDSRWITFIDSDDWVNGKYLEFMHQAVIDNQVAVCRCGMKVQYGQNEIERQERYESVVLPIEQGYILENSGSNVCAQAKLYLKELFRNVRFPLGRLHEDLFTTYRIMFQCEKISLVSCELYYYRVNENGITHSVWNPRRWDEIEAFEEQLQFLKANGYQSVFCMLLQKYVQAIAGQYVQIQKDAESIASAKQWLSKLRRQMRVVLCSNIIYSTLHFKKYAWCYEIAFPVTMKIYWMAKAARKKLRKKF